MTHARPLIAVVDDDESICRALKRLVRSCGMDAETFASGQEFVDLIAAEPSFSADCVVLDVRMPGLNGLEVQERLARINRQVPVVFITAHEEVGTRQRALRAGAVGFLCKPFNDEVFLAALRTALATGSVSG